MTWSQRWTLGQRITALVAVIGALLGLISVSAAVAAATNRSQVDTLLVKIGPLRTSAEKLLTAMVDQETGVRGYAINGKPADLEPYTRGVADEQRLENTMLPLLAGEPRTEAQLRDIRSQAAAWRADVAEPVIAAVRGGQTNAALGLLTEESRARFDGIRRAIAALQQDLLRLRMATSDRVTQSGNTLVLLLIIAAVVVVFGGIALAVLLSRLVTRPVTELAAQLREVSGGDYERKISSDGPPEVVSLANDIDAMRKQIAADLSEVRAARLLVEAANTRLEQQTEELTRSNRDLEQFAYVASHDLQEPLRKVASFCQLLQRRYAGQLDERADQYIGFAVDGAQRMQRLINDLLAFSRVGRVTSGFTEVDLNKLVIESASQVESVRERTGAEITFEDLPTVLGEEPLLQALVSNLISNSLKFRKPDIPPRIHLSAQRDGDYWEINCRDNGIGIEPEFADKVFVIFQRLHAKDAYPGTGIGLAIGKKIVEHHGGRIWVDTDHTGGTSMSFTLPVVPDHSGSGTPSEPVAVAAEPSRTTDETEQAVEPAKETVA